MTLILNSIRLTEQVSTYMLARFQWYLAGTNSPAPRPVLDMPVSLVLECELLAMKAAQAFSNRGIELAVRLLAQPEYILVQVSWDADRYADMLGARPTGQKEAFEKALQTRWPIDAQNKNRYINQPCIVHDRNGKILFWYLPDTLTSGRQVCEWQATAIWELTIAENRVHYGKLF